MKPAARRILYRIVLPGLVITFFAGCQQVKKHPLGQWPLKPPAGAQFANYEERQNALHQKVQVQLDVNGDSWKADVQYRDGKLLALNASHGQEGALGKVMSQEYDTVFALPMLGDTDTTLDLTERWVSPDFETGGRIITEDINFDGHTDLVLLNALESSLSQRAYHIWLFNPKAHNYYCWKPGARIGGELIARNRRRRELMLATPDNEEYVYRVSGDTALRLVKKSSEL